MGKQKYLIFLLMFVALAVVLSMLPDNDIAHPVSDLAVVVGGAVLLSMGKKTRLAVPMFAAATFCLLIGIAQFWALSGHPASELGRATDRITSNVGEFPMGADAPWLFSFPVWVISIFLLALGAWVLALLLRAVAQRVEARTP